MNAIKERAHIIEAILKFGKISEAEAVGRLYLQDPEELAKLAWDKGQALAEVFKQKLICF